MEDTSAKRYLCCLFFDRGSSDSLSMWYMYADQGSGVCLEFEGQEMIGVHQSKFPDFPEQAYAFVTYDIKEFKHGIANFLQSIVNFMRQFLANGGDMQKLNDGDFLFFVSYYISVAALSFKNRKFGHEKEFRVFCRMPRNEGLPHVGFCPTTSGAVRAYISIQYPKLSKSLLRSVWLGPANLSEPDVLKIFFAQRAGRLIEVKKSEIPFRKL